MKNKVLIYFLIIGNHFLNAQAPAIQWQNRIGGLDWNVSYSSKNAIDGGFIIGGRSNSNISGDKTENSRGGYDYWIVKATSLGQIEWDKTIGGASPSGNEQDWFYNLNLTSDGGYIYCGYSSSPISGDKTEAAIENSPDFWIVKTNNIGIIQWQNVIGGSLGDEATVIEMTQDNGYIVGGYSDSSISYDKAENCRGLQDYWVVKLNNLGNIVWQKTLGGSGNDLLNSIIQTNDGGYLLGGSSNSNISGDKTANSKGSADYWIIKLDSFGNQLWQKTIGGSGFDQLWKVIQTNDGGYFLAGYSDSPISGDKSDINKGSYDYWLLKVDANGNIEWQKTYGGSESDTVVTAQKCSDGGFIIPGFSYSGISGDKTEISNGNNDAWIIRINNSGNILWQKTIGGNNSDGFNAVSQTTDGGFFLSGGTNSIISGSITQNPKGIQDYWIMKLAPENLSTPTNENNFTYTIYPNPANNVLNITTNAIIGFKSINIYNMLGQIVLSTTTSETVLSIDVSNFTIGTYSIKISSDAGIANSKFIKN